MTIKNPKLFGLDANRALADVKNKNACLVNLGVSPLDLEVIYGARNANPPVTFDDWRSFSRLQDPLWRTLDRYYTDSQIYQSALIDRAGSTSMLFGNLVINGKLSGNAIRYRYIAGSGANAETKIADISTSRVSAWSSSVPEPIPATAAISYGSRIAVRTGGQLKFGSSTTGTAGQHQLKTSLTPVPTEFAAELPTSKIQAKINGKTIEFYAMKGIPLSFRGFFRSFSGSVGYSAVSIGGNEINPSWKVERVDGGGYSNFADQESISFSAVRSRERWIRLYYPADKITRITLNSANIFEMPVAKFSLLTELYLNYNEFKNFPDLTTNAPSLAKLDFSHNYFYLSETAGERRLNQAIADKIPSSLRELTLGGSFYGSIEQNIFDGDSTNGFPNLTFFHIGRSSRAHFHPDNDDQSPGSCTLPNVNETVTTYRSYSHDFRRIDPSTGAGGTANGTTRCNVKQLPSLVYLHIGSNYYLGDSNFTLNCPSTLNYFNISSTGLRCPALTNYVELESVYATWTRNFGTFFSADSYSSSSTYSGYKFTGCNKLKTISIGYAYVTGPIPKFENTSLENIYMYGVRLHGGDPNIAGGGTYVIPGNTFSGCPNLKHLDLNSSYLLEKEIHPDAFAGLVSLNHLRLQSNRRIIGNIPEFSTNASLSYLNLDSNAFTGAPPSFSSNPNIRYAYLQNNQLSGAVPSIKNLSNLNYLYLHGNNLTAVNTFENLPYLYRLYLHNNQIVGEIPDFTECTRLRYLMLYSNNWTSYKEGSFKELYYLKWLDITNTNLSQASYNQIIDDLYDNWETVKRSGVTINSKRIRPMGVPDTNPYLEPSPEQEEKIQELNNNGWNWVYKNIN